MIAVDTVMPNATRYRCSRSIAQESRDPQTHSSLRCCRNHVGMGGRRALKLPQSSNTTTFTLLTFFFLLCCTSASAFYIPQPSPTPTTINAYQRGILVDRRPLPLPSTFFDKREAAAAAATSSASGTVTAVSTLVVAATSTSSSLPTPFDSSLGNNFTSSDCPDFFDTFLSNETFLDCEPFSLLLQNSEGFFDVEKSILKTNALLDYTCSVSFKTCSAVMADIANELISDSACGTDYTRENPTVVQAYNGLVAYDVLWKASCLQASNGNYCFANAVTNTSSPEDAYVYYLPLGVSLPGSSRPTCNKCLQNTFGIYSNYASNSSQPLSETYNDAATLIDMGCGSYFVNNSVSITSGTSRTFEQSTYTLTLSAIGLALLTIGTCL